VQKNGAAAAKAAAAKIKELKKVADASQKVLAKAQKKEETAEAAAVETKVEAGAEGAAEGLLKVKKLVMQSASEKVAQSKAEVAGAKDMKAAAKTEEKAAASESKTMRKVESETKSPAVKAASEKIESDDLDQIKKTVAHEMDAAKTEQVAKQAAVDVKKAAIKKAKDAKKSFEQANADLVAKKDIAALKMHITGSEFNHMIHKSSNNRQAASDFLKQIKKEKKQFLTVTSYTKSKAIKKKIETLQDKEKTADKNAQDYDEESDALALKQRKIAKALQKDKEALLERVMSTQVSSKTKEELQADTRYDEKNTAAIEVAKEGEKLANRQKEAEDQLAKDNVKRMKDEKKVKADQAKLDTVSTGTLPELQGKKVKVPRQIIRLRTRALRKDIRMRKNNIIQQKKDEVRAAMKIEKFKSAGRKKAKESDKLESAVALAKKKGDAVAVKMAEKKRAPSTVVKKTEKRMNREKALKRMTSLSAPTKNGSLEKFDKAKPKTEVNALNSKITVEQKEVAQVKSKLTALQKNLSPA